MAQGLLAETPQGFRDSRHHQQLLLEVFCYLLSQAKPGWRMGRLTVTRLMYKHHQTLPALLLTWYS